MQLEDFFEKYFFNTARIVSVDSKNIAYRIHVQQYLLPKDIRPAFNARSNTHNSLARWHRLEEALDRPRNKHKKLYFHSEASKLIEEQVWVYEDTFENIRHLYEDSTPDDITFYVLHAIHLVSQPNKADHKIRICLDSNASSNALYFEGQLKWTRLEIISTRWYPSLFF